MNIFISHAQNDKPVANALSKLLSTGFHIKAANIFCSSIPGQGIPAGARFVEYIHSRLDESDLVFLIISPNYLASEFCIAELGGTWATQKEFIPFKLPSVKYDDLRATLLGVQVSKLDEEVDVLAIRDKIEKTFQEHDLPDVALSAVRIGEFIDDLKKLLPKLPKPQNIPRGDFEAEVRQSKILKADIKELKQELADKEALIKQLEKAKDATEVRTIKLANSTDDEQFDAATKMLRTAYHKIPPIVAKAFYYTLHATGEFWPEGNDEHDAARTAAEAQLFNRIGGEDEYQLNLSHPKVKAAKKALAQFERELRNLSDEWIQAYEEEHEITFDLSNREFYDSLVEW